MPWKSAGARDDAEPVALTRNTVMTPFSPTSAKFAVPATTMLPSGWIARASASIGCWPIMKVDAPGVEVLPKVASGVPSALNRMTGSASSVKTVPGSGTDAVPARTTLPSGASAREYPARPSESDTSREDDATPSTPKVGSSVPSASRRVAEKAPAAPPARTILPSGWIATPVPDATKFVGVGPVGVRMTSPLVPKEGSGAPRSSSRMATMSWMLKDDAKAEVAVPVTTILPSGWMATPPAVPSVMPLIVIGRSTIPAGPEMGVEHSIVGEPDGDDLGPGYGRGADRGAHQDDLAVGLDRDVGDGRQVRAEAELRLPPGAEGRVDQALGIVPGDDHAAAVLGPARDDDLAVGLDRHRGDELGRLQVGLPVGAEGEVQGSVGVQPGELEAPRRAGRIAVLPARDDDLAVGLDRHRMRGRA